MDKKSDKPEAVGSFSEVTRAKKDKKPSAPSSTGTKKTTDPEPTITDTTEEGSSTVFIGVSGWWKNRWK